MRKLVIAAHGDNDALHEKALRAAVEAVERVNHAPVYRAWIEPTTVQDAMQESARYVLQVATRAYVAEAMRVFGRAGKAAARLQGLGRL